MEASNARITISLSNSPHFPLFSFLRSDTSNPPLTVNLRRIWEGRQEGEDIVEDLVSTLERSNMKVELSPVVVESDTTRFNATFFPITLSAKARFASVEFVCIVEQDLTMIANVVISHYTWLST